MLQLDQTARRSVSPLAMYFQEIDESALLTAEDEQELAWRVQQGDGEARDQMVKANLRLVVSLARQFAGRGHCLTDLIQEGNLGLVHAVERFDPSQHTRFSTYAKYWIQEALRKALEKMAGPVRVPGYANDLMANWRAASSELHSDLGRRPRDEEVAARLHLSPRRLAIVQKAQRIHNFVSQQESQDERRLAVNFLVDSPSTSPDARMTANDEMGHVLKLLQKLPGREATVLRMRFGLDGNEPMNLQEIGDHLNLTRERVRQLEKKGLAALRDDMGEAN